MPLASGARRILFFAAALAAVVGNRADDAAAQPAARRSDLLQDIPGAADVAAPANGQTLYILDATTAAVTAVDPFEPGNRWVALAPAAGSAGPVEAVSVGCIDTGMLAVLGRWEDGWAIRTHRVQPGTAADAATPAQKVGIAAGDDAAAPERPADAASLVVSPSRDWLAVCGLPAPWPPVLRAPIAGARIGPLSAKACPGRVAGAGPGAATISVADELLLFAADRTRGEDGRIFVSFSMPPDPRRLLHLDTSLRAVRDAAYCRADGTLWVVGVGGTEGGESDGLWRLDAVLRDGRQAIKAVCVAKLEAARSVACLSERTIVVIHGRGPRIVSRIDPTQPPIPR